MVVGSTGWLVRRWMVGASKEGENMAGAYVYLFLGIFILFFLFFLAVNERGLCYQGMTFFSPFLQE